MNTQHAEVATFLSPWDAAEMSGDASAFGEALADNFTAFGPLGFALSKEDWLENGPYKVQGPMRAIDTDGGEYAVDVGDVYLYRCSESQTKPFCDGTHARIASKHPSARGHPSAG